MISPLLSNIMLDDLDKELEKRGHSFVRYADDCNIYVKTEAKYLTGWRGYFGSLKPHLFCKILNRGYGGDFVRSCGGNGSGERPGIRN